MGLLFVLLGAGAMVFFLIEAIGFVVNDTGNRNVKCNGHNWEPVDLENGQEKLRCKQCGKTFPEVLND